MTMRGSLLVLMVSGCAAWAAGCNDNTSNPPADTGVHNDSSFQNFIDSPGATDSGATAMDVATVVDAGTPVDVPVQPAAATFTTVYTTIISQRCAPCHTTSNGIGVTSGLLDMTSQAAAFASLVNVAAAGSGCAGMGTRVVPGSPDTSIMYLKVNPAVPAPCGSKMPLGGPALSTQEADTIRSWIMGGANND